MAKLSLEQVQVIKNVSVCHPKFENLRPTRDEAIDLIDTVEGLYDDIEILKEQKQVYKKHWLELTDKILAELDKDGWCKLTMTKEEALEMKRVFEELN